MDINGTHQKIDVCVGQSLRDELKRCGLPLDGECDSAMICSSCHIKLLGADWASTLDPRSDEERDLLETLSNYGNGSRLACQTLVEQRHENLTLCLLPTSISL
ncbi:MAG: 2Fe-2S iron-sulfur cluster-binding protein [Alphaproteobacteria bacterium]